MLNHGRTLFTLHRGYEILTFGMDSGKAGGMMEQKHNILIEQKMQRDELLRQSQEIAHVGSWTYEHKKNLLIWSDEAYRIFGVPMHAFRGTMEAFNELVHPEDIVRVRDAFFRSLREGEPGYEIEHRIIKMDTGEMRFVHEKCLHVRNASGVAIRSNGMVQDITERRLAEEALRTSEEKYRLIAENASDVIYVMNRTQNRYTYFSPNILQLRGLTVEEAMNEPLEAVLTLESLIVVKDNIARDMKEFIDDPASAKTHISEIRQPCKNGDWIWVEVSTKYRYGVSGDIEVVGIVRNIDARKKAEKELLIAKNKSDAAVVAKGQFLANMSHEIRTPMNGMLGMLQLLEMSTLDEEQQELVGICRNSAETLLYIINDILDYSKIEAGKLSLDKRPFSLRDLIRGVIVLFDLVASRKALFLESHVEQDVPDQLIGDPFRVRQILSNLIGNAVKFTKKGRIDVSVRNLHIWNRQEVTLEFMVRDTGIGITEEGRAALFERFSQVDGTDTRRYGGTGLGLAISQSLVELMAGRIWVESRMGEGSAFFFTCVLDRVDSEQAARMPVGMVQDEIEQQRVENLLLVEDDDTSRLLIIKLAMKKGWKITVAENGDDAIGIFRCARFDAVLMDIQMPVMNGYEVTKFMRQFEERSKRHTPIIAVTANVMKADQERCLDAGMDDYISKPVNADEFFTVVKKWCSFGKNQ